MPGLGFSGANLATVAYADVDGATGASTATNSGVATTVVASGTYVQNIPRIVRIIQVQTQLEHDPDAQQSGNEDAHDERDRSATVPEDGFGDFTGCLAAIERPEREEVQHAQERLAQTSIHMAVAIGACQPRSTKASGKGIHVIARMAAMTATWITLPARIATMRRQRRSMASMLTVIPPSP